MSLPKSPTESSDDELHKATEFLFELEENFINEGGVYVPREEDLDQHELYFIGPLTEQAWEERNIIQAFIDISENGEGSASQTSKSTVVDKEITSFEQSPIGTQAEEVTALVQMLDRYQLMVDELTQTILSFKSQYLAKKMKHKEKILLNDLFVALKKLNIKDYERMMADYNLPPGGSIIKSSPGKSAYKKH